MAGMSYFRGGPNIPEAVVFPVAIVRTSDRAAGIAKAVAMLGTIDFAGQEVYLKASYNSPHPFPATTHPEALRAAMEMLFRKGARTVTVVERSGMGATRDILSQLKVPDLVRELNASWLALDELAPAQWRHAALAGSHWVRGIEVPDFLDAAGIIQVCCLKTHRFGGQFSASLKNSIGLIAKYDSRDSRNYMQELHASPWQCSMIAEVNQAYAPALVVMDAMKIFINGGPETGEIAEPGIIAASRDRVALDAVGVAILQFAGARTGLNGMRAFEQEQIKRAAALKLGAQSAGEIELLTEDAESRRLAARLKSIL